MHLNKTACEIWSVFDKVQFWVKNLAPFFHRSLQINGMDWNANLVYWVSINFTSFNNFDFHPGISGIFGWMVCFSEIQQFPYFLELFPGNFRTICPSFENLELFGRMVSTHVYTDTEKFHPSLPSQCFNPRQLACIALNFQPNLFVRWESPLLEDLFLE